MDGTVLMRWLAVALLLTGCCAEEGPPRLTGGTIVRVGARDEGLSFAGDEQRISSLDYFAIDRIGSPDKGRLRTVPMLEMIAEEDGTVIELERFDDSRVQSCAKRELYDPVDEQLVVGARYLLVHRASAAPGNIEDSGGIEGALADELTSFDGEPAFVAVVRIFGP